MRRFRVKLAVGRLDFDARSVLRAVGVRAALALLTSSYPFTPAFGDAEEEEQKRLWLLARQGRLRPASYAQGRRPSKSRREGGGGQLQHHIASAPTPRRWRCLEPDVDRLVA